MNTVHIRCQVYPGMFDNEWYVLVSDSAAYFVHKTNVVKLEGTPLPDKGVDGRVLGYLVEKADDKVLVQLPGEVAVGGIRTWVDHADVTLAA